MIKVDPRKQALRDYESGKTYDDNPYKILSNHYIEWAKEFNRQIRIELNESNIAAGNYA